MHRGKNTTQGEELDSQIFISAIVYLMCELVRMVTLCCSVCCVHCQDCLLLFVIVCSHFKGIESLHVNMTWALYSGLMQKHSKEHPPPSLPDL